MASGLHGARRGVRERNVQCMYSLSRLLRALKERYRVLAEKIKADWGEATFDGLAKKGFSEEVVFASSTEE